MAADLGVVVVSQQGDMLDYLVWKHYGRQDGRRVEQVLDHARNYHLPDRSEILPLGTKVYMPDIPEPYVTSTVQLWG